MKKLLQRTIALCLALFAILSLAGCDGGLLARFGIFFDEFVPNEIKDVVKDTYENTYRDQLSPNEAAVYDAVAAAEPGENVFTVRLPEWIEVCRGKAPTEEEKASLTQRISYWLANALYAVWLDVPSIFWLETGNFTYSYALSRNKEAVYCVSEVILTVEKRENAENAAVYQQEINTLLSGLSLERETDAETARAINDYLCARIQYEDDEDRQNVYGALIGRKCVCEGYAHAFKLLCDLYGVRCVSIVGIGHTEAGSTAHIWNAVCLDGAWYAVDVTWNDQEEGFAKNAFFLVGGESEIFDEPFSESHEETHVRGTSKTFATPVLAEREYSKK